MSQTTVQVVTLESPLTRAIEADKAYRGHHQMAEDFKVERNLLLEEAYKKGELELDGYKVIKAKEAETVTFDSVLDYDLEHGTTFQNDYILWFRQNCPLKITPELFRAFLSHSGISEDIADKCMTRKVTDTCVYRLNAPKGGQ